VSFLKRLFGTTDALEDARAQAVKEAEATSAGWGSPTTREEGELLVIEMHAPGLDPESFVAEPEGSTFHVKASGSSDRPRVKTTLDETINFAEGSDLSGATATYVDDKVVIRIPKSGLKQTQSSA
jgi:HSP20 family molecular chaperone IbpA